MIDRWVRGTFANEYTSIFIHTNIRTDLPPGLSNAYRAWSILLFYNFFRESDDQDS